MKHMFSSMAIIAGMEMESVLSGAVVATKLAEVGCIRPCSPQGLASSTETSSRMAMVDR